MTVKLLTVKARGDKLVLVEIETARDDLLAYLSTALQHRRDAFLRARHHKSDSVAKLIAANPKLAEWKAKTEVTSTKEWIRRRKDLDDAEHDVEILRILLGVTVVHHYGGTI